MTRKPVRGFRTSPLRVLALSAAISMALIGGTAQADPNPFARRGLDPSAQAARAAQQQGLQSVRAQQAAQKSLAAFGRAAQVRSALDAAQVAARAAAAASQIGNNVPNGLGEGGLKIAAGVRIEPGAILANDPRLGESKLWLGAKTPTQRVDGADTTVTIEQTQKKAILSWETFNVGKQTTVYFDQRGGNQSGGNDWIALNRVDDPSGRPSQILGRIKAEGSVYLLNRNGVMFGGGSQVNTRSLVASSLNLFDNDVAKSNRIFINEGIQRARQDTQDAFVLTSERVDYSGSGALPGQPGDIRIEAGAQIKTAAGGYALIAAPNISNAGSVQGEDGQVQMAAVIGARAGQPSGGNDLRLRYGDIGTVAGIDPAALGYGRFDNTGIIASKRGEVTLTGHDIRQDGYVGTTTGVSRPGKISIVAANHTRASDANSAAELADRIGGSLSFGRDSATVILPERDGETTTSAPSADKAFQPPSATLAGAQIRFQENSLVLMPGAKLDLVGMDVLRQAGVKPPPGRILLEHDATLNVAGLTDVQRPISDNYVTIERIGENELADSPLLRGGGLFRQKVLLDIREHGVTDDGRAWVGSPLLNAAGYADQVPRKIDQMLVDGGSINVIGREFIARSGSTMELGAGYVHYLGGMVESRRLLGADGRRYSLADADPSQNYLGFADAYTLDHQRWDVQEVFASPLGGRERRYESDYLEGGDAGSLSIRLKQDASGGANGVESGLLLAGDIHAEAESGRHQIERGELARGGVFKLSVDNGPFTDWRLQSARSEDAPAGFGMNTVLPQQFSADGSRVTTLSTQLLNAAGFGTVELNDPRAHIDVAADAQLQVQAGGRIALSGSRINVDGGLQAESGDIVLSAAAEFDNQLKAGERRGITVGSGARLSTRGQWVNDGDRIAEQRSGGANIDGGSIRLSTTSRLQNSGGELRDASGAIVLERGAVLDVSGGGRILPDGSLAQKDGVPLGRGGDIALLTYQPAAGDENSLNGNLPASFHAADGEAGQLRFQDATVRAGGLAGGGRLSLQARDIQIGGAAADDARTLQLDAGFFEQGDFGSYDLIAQHDATIAADTTVRISQRNFVPSREALRSLPTGSDLYAGLNLDGRGINGAFGLIDTYHRPAADFALEAGAATGRTLPNHPQLSQLRDTLLFDQGAQLQLDAGGDARLGSRGQLTVLGGVTAHGGSIALSGDTSVQGLSPSHSPAPIDYWRGSKSVWVGQNAVLDVSGLALLDPFKTPLPQGGAVPRDGRLLDGGRITLSSDSGYVVVEQGAQLNLSGARAVFDLPADSRGLGNAPLAPRTVWSAGGDLVLSSAAGLYFDGDIHAAGGDAQARGGSVQLLAAQSTRPLDNSGGRAPLATSAIVFHQDGSRLNVAAKPGEAIEPGAAMPSGKMYFAADRLDGSGIDTLLVGIGEDGLPQGPLVAPVVFDGAVDLSLSRALMMNARAFVAGDASGEAKLSAAYVSLQGLLPGSDRGRVLAEPGRPGDARLSVDAGFIDIGGRVSLQNFGDARFASRGDLRLHTPTEYQSVAVAGETRQVPGELLTSGDLTLSAAQVYPASGETFIVRALGARNGAGATAPREETTIRIEGNGNAAALPLSAGGRLLFDASHIEQAGVVRAPGGRIVLGAGAATDPDTLALFGGLTLTPTQSVKLSAGSLTSVSLDGRVLPYGKTVDGLQWNASDIEVNLNAPSARQVRIDGADLALDEGARVDLSGGGDLQAFEWIAGTGGSRDVLSAVGTSYADGGSGSAAYLYPDQRGVYAVVPGVQSPLAASDPLLSQGQAGGEVGKSVYLSGVQGLADGVYTLLPGRYATLPGAFRVVQRSGGQDSLSSRNLTAPDGTQVVAGYYVDSLSGARDARSNRFEVQSREVWGRYSQYQLSSANTFFAARAAKAGSIAPNLPRDGGQLVLSAQRALELGARLDVAAAAGGAAAQVDIVADAIQIRGDAQAARDGYVQLDAKQLSALGAGSLLIGGVRSQTGEGTRIDARTRDLIVSNDATAPLQGAEIVLVARASDGTQGLKIEEGSVIQARGQLAGASDRPLLIGAVADSASNTAAVSGDGALLRVSNAGAVDVQRRNVPAFEQSRGLLRVGESAKLDGGASLTLDSTGQAVVDASASLGGRDIQANSGRIAFTQDDGDHDGFVIGRNTLNQFAAAERVSLRSYGDMAFFGDISVDTDRQLSLSAGRFVGDGGTVTLRADRLSLSNDLGAASTANADASGSGVLQLRGGEVVFGGGDKRLLGFGAVSVDANRSIAVQQRGSFDFGAASLGLRSPLIQADAGADNTLRTTGAILLARSAGDAGSARPQGGAIGLDGASISGNALIRANSGKVGLHARTGDLRLNDGTAIDTSAVPKAIFDQTVYSPGGRIELQADHGAIRLASNASLDVSADAGGGDAGELRIVAPERQAELLGALKGSAPKGRGGRIDIDVGAALDLDGLSQRLNDGGINQRVAVRTRSGDLALSAGHTLKAREISLTADGGADATTRDADNGNVRIAGTLDASGTSGGKIELWGRHGVDIDGRLLANGSAANKRGGEVKIGTGGVSDGTLNADYGYQNVRGEDAGIIRIGRDALIDVRGGSAGGLSGGRVDLRAPLLQGGDVNVVIEDGQGIVGAREVGLEAYAVWSTTDAHDDSTIGKHFDGIVDPAGWYDAQGQLLPGTWTDASGAVLAPPTTPEQLKQYLNRHFFAPDQANRAHQTFYGYVDGDTEAHQSGTLMGFVRNPGFAFGDRFAGVANFRARPGVELRNPDPAINGGAIRVLTNWNLNSGELGNLDFRYNGAAPVLTLRADGDVEVAATISDGFYNYNASGGGAVGSYPVSHQRYTDALSVIDPIAYDYLPEPVQYDGDSEEIGQYYGQYDELLKMLTDPAPELDDVFGPGTSFLKAIEQFLLSGPVDPDPPILGPAPPTSPSGYGDYVSGYRDYLLRLTQQVFDPGIIPTVNERPVLPVLGPVPAAADRTPSLQASALKPMPFADKILAGGDSSSYRFIAGADFSSVAPGVVRGDQNADLKFDGHTTLLQNGKRELLMPNMVRTGTGAIDLAASRDIRFADRDAPASIYTAGRPGEGTSADRSRPTVDSNQSASNTALDIIVTGPVNPEAAGDIGLRAGRDIVGNRQIYDDAAGSRSGNAGSYLGQYWWPWMQTGNVLADDQRTLLSTSINFGGFAQGLLSVGGDIDISAGRDIREVSASAPTTWVKDGNALRVFGGGDIRVDAGRDLLGGDFFVAKGEGEINAGGRIGSAFDLDALVFIDNISAVASRMRSAVAPILAMQDANWRVTGAQDVEIGRVLNPSYARLPENVADSQSYGRDTQLSVTSVAGDLSFDTLSLGDVLFAYGNRSTSRAQAPYEIHDNPIFAQVLPSTLSLSAAAGDLSLHNGGQLFPSANSQLSLLAGGDLHLLSDQFPLVDSLRMLDIDPDWMPSPFRQLASLPGETAFDYALIDRFEPDRNQRANLHQGDAELVRIYALGDILGGIQSERSSLNTLRIDLPKPATVRAGRDIVDLDFRGQNYRASDATRILAGRDLYYRPLARGNGAFKTSQSWLQIGGPGTFEVQTGRDLGPLTSANEAYANNQLKPDGGGIRSIGNRDNAGLPFQGADLVVRFGVAPGVNTRAFAQRYLDPSSADAASYSALLIAYMQQLRQDDIARNGGSRDGAAGDAPALNAEQAWQAFAQQPDAVQQRLVDKVFLDVLKRAGRDNKDPASAEFGKYAAGYRAINTLFPAALGYTANQLEGGQNGAEKPVSTGQLDMRGSTLQTQQGGDIRILGPGGDIQVGSVAAPPMVVNNQGAVVIGPNQQGILTLDIGDIGLFADRSVLLAQSRIFTQRGGDLLIWSSNGDINAGKGAKTSSDKPPVRYVCDIDHNCRIDAKGLVSGAGIATLQTVPGAKAGDAVLVAPRGTIDAGDAGIRISGNLIVAAQTVANADNIQVDGDSIGIPVARGVDTGALSAASSASSGVNAVAQDMAGQRPALATRDIPALISVQVIGFGTCGADDPRCANSP
ncbi:filamentous hemagglutinin family N-terminal domain protein [Lysobacter capsici]|uniref:filamentous hemagglutinin family protein n=1 Tax=Lysobacter capsici TaxID=435897 RepID=UPI0007166506|nr:filamentous hemagglutinin family protein [Lysobacter capsici]ALN85816.1 filamentous hemagglutinin family N-terminal domain protein [Lysobacter capsici]